MTLKVHGNHLTCQTANKCLNVSDREEVTERNKDVPPSRGIKMSPPLFTGPPFPYFAMSSISVKENPDRKKPK